MQTEKCSKITKNVKIIKIKECCSHHKIYKINNQPEMCDSDYNERHVII